MPPVIILTIKLPFEQKKVLGCLPSIQNLRACCEDLAPNRNPSWYLFRDLSRTFFSFVFIRVCPHQRRKWRGVITHAGPHLNRAWRWTTFIFNNNEMTNCLQQKRSNESCKASWSRGRKKPGGPRGRQISSFHADRAWLSKAPLLKHEFRSWLVRENFTGTPCYIMVWKPEHLHWLRGYHNTSMVLPASNRKRLFLVVSLKIAQRSLNLKFQTLHSSF